MGEPNQQFSAYATWILKSEYKDCKDCNAAKQGRSSHSHDIYSSVKGHCRDNKDMASALAELRAVLWVWSSMRNTCIQSVLQFWIQLFVNTMKLLYKLPIRACVTDLNNIQALKGFVSDVKIICTTKALCADIDHIDVITVQLEKFHLISVDQRWDSFIPLFCKTVVWSLSYNLNFSIYRCIHFQRDF